MGKRYHCDYCDKSMVSSPSIIKTHNKGLSHQKLVHEHYQQYKDPETILEEEKNKKPCSRFVQGSCQFGAICRFSHYTREELDTMKEYVATKNIINQEFVQPSFQVLYQELQNEKDKSSENSDNNTLLIDDKGVTHILPWTYNSVFDSFGEDLPPSVKRFKIEDFNNAEITEWG